MQCSTLTASVTKWMLVVNYNASAVTGTGGGGHGGTGHVPRGQPAGIGAGQLYFLVVTACLVLAIMAIWLLCYGVKWCRKICKKRKSA